MDTACVIDAHFEENHVVRNEIDILSEKNIIRIDNVGEDGSQLGFVSSEGLTYVFSEDGTIAYIMCDNSVTLNGAHGGQSFEEIMELLGSNQIKSYSLGEYETYYYLDYYYGNIKYRFRSLNDETGNNCVLIGIYTQSYSDDAIQVVFEIEENAGATEASDEIDSKIITSEDEFDGLKGDCTETYSESSIEEISESVNPIVNEEKEENE